MTGRNSNVNSMFVSRSNYNTTKYMTRSTVTVITNAAHACGPLSAGLVGKTRKRVSA